MMETKDLRLFDYLDYRNYLKEHYRSKKSVSANFSYKAFSRAAGLGSPCYLRDVMTGRRNITPNTIGGFCKALGLGKRERTYFENLVRFNQATKPEAKREYYEQLLPTYKKECGIKLKKNQYKLLSQWYFPIIREMISLDDFDESSKWICKRLKNLITPSQARKTIQLLLELKLIERDQSGKLKITDTSLDTPDAVHDVAFSNFHKEMLERAKSAIDKDKAFDREISGITAAMSKKQFGRIKQYIQEFQNKLVYELQQTDEPAEEVYQVNCQLFSLTRSQENKNGKDS